MAENNSSAPLLPCPFCGASARGYEIEPHQHSAALLALVPNMPKEHQGSYVIEGDCQCGSGLIGDNQSEVTARWNARAPQAVAAQAAPASVAVPDERWCPDVCPITGREFFMWVTHHESGDDVPTYGGPFDSYTIPTQDKDGSFSCERYDHDFGGWKDWENVGLMLVDDQSFVVAPDNPRYYEIEQFATPALPATEDSSAGDLAAAPASRLTMVQAEAIAFCSTNEPTALLRYWFRKGYTAAADQAEVQAEPVSSDPVAWHSKLYGTCWMHKQPYHLDAGTHFFVRGNPNPVATVLSGAAIQWHTGTAAFEHGTFFYTAPQAQPADAAITEKAAKYDRLAPYLCKTCGGFGLVGGHCQDGSFDSQHCPDCNQPADALDAEIAKLKKAYQELGNMFHDQIVAQQAAWIEWQHGAGAEAGMQWIENGLCGPGHIPDEDEPYGTEAQAYFDANKSDPFPACYCGRPSNILWMGKGFCSDSHHDEHRAAMAAAQEGGKA